MTSIISQCASKIAIKRAATLVLAAVTTFGAAQIAAAADKATSKAPQIKSKQCVMLFSPRYRKLRIKPIEVSFRWCSQNNPSDCTKWEKDTIADQGKPFTIAAYCFTHHTPVVMDLRYNKRFGDEDSRATAKIQPHAMPLKDNLAPHPFCGTKAAHRFEMKKDSASMATGKPRAAILPKCVWQPIEKKEKPEA